MIHEILDVVMKINRETEHAAWFEIIGHVGWLQVYVTESKQRHHVRSYDAKRVYYELAGEDELKEIYNKLIDFLPKQSP